MEWNEIKSATDDFKIAFFVSQVYLSMFRWVMWVVLVVETIYILKDNEGLQGLLVIHEIMIDKEIWIFGFVCILNYDLFVFRFGVLIIFVGKQLFIPMIQITYKYIYINSQSTTRMYYDKKKE